MLDWEGGAGDGGTWGLCSASAWGYLWKCAVTFAQWCASLVLEGSWSWTLLMRSHITTACVMHREEGGEGVAADELGKGQPQRLLLLIHRITVEFDT